MMDRRLTPANGRVADMRLKGQVEAESFVIGTKQRVCSSITNLWGDQAGTRIERQLLFGDHFNVLEKLADLSYGQSEKDGFVGYVSTDDLCDPVASTHVVSVRGSHVYSDADMKSRPIRLLSFGSQVRSIGFVGKFAKIETGGFIFAEHLIPIDERQDDPVLVAQIFLGTPYLWGGNSGTGIDCSGLAQASLLACGIRCPGDSDLQEADVGRLLVEEEPTERGDLLFWKGHVALALDETRMIHATANSMSVVIENIANAVKRISDQGAGNMTSRKRLLINRQPE